MESRIRQALEASHGEQVAQKAQLTEMGGHASLRIYWRIQLPESADAPREDLTQIAMVLPESRRAGESEEGMSEDAPNSAELPFVNVQRYLDSIEMPVPAIDLVDMDLGVLLLEDLGDRTFEGAVEELRRRDDLEPEEREAAFLDLYREAIDLLVDLQESVLRSLADERFGTNDQCIAFERAFDRKLLRWELDHYVEWGLEARLGDDDARRTALDERRETLDQQLDRLVDELLDVQRTLVLRDYQSRNLMLHEGRWHLIDFQDALKGPFIYDLVALLRDSYIELTAEQVDELLDYYVCRGAANGLPWCSDSDAVFRAFHLQTVQRKLKDAGRFVYIDRKKGNPDFLQYYDRSIDYVRHALDSIPGWDALASLLSRVEPSFEE
ncbi:MAG: aminoglycoside phosphotransferase family protein [Persicimonas sp.]